MMLMHCFCVFFLLMFFIKACYRYSFELHQQVDAIQMGTHNICLYKEVDKKYTGCYMKTTKLLDCALIGVCAVIRSNTVLVFIRSVLLGTSDEYNMFERRKMKNIYLDTLLSNVM